MNIIKKLVLISAVIGLIAPTIYAVSPITFTEQGVVGYAYNTAPVSGDNYIGYGLISHLLATSERIDGTGLSKGAHAVIMLGLITLGYWLNKRFRWKRGKWNVGCSEVMIALAILGILVCCLMMMFGGE